MPTAAPAAAPTPIPIALPELYPPGGAVYPPVPPVPPEPPVPPPPPYWADAAAHTARQSVLIPVNRTIHREAIVFSSSYLAKDSNFRIDGSVSLKTTELPLVLFHDSRWSFRRTQASITILECIILCSTIIWPFMPLSSKPQVWQQLNV